MHILFFLILICLDSRSVCMYNLPPSLHHCLRCRTSPSSPIPSPFPTDFSFIPSSLPILIALLTIHPSSTLASRLSLFSVLGFVWVESVSRGRHCIVYTTYTYDLHVYLTVSLPIPLRSFPLSMYSPLPPSFIPPLCILMYPGGTRIYVRRRME